METSPGEEGFKHLPLRMFRRDRQMVQRLFKTVTAAGPEEKRKKLTLRDLIKEAMPEEDPDEGEEIGQNNLENCSSVPRKSFLLC